MRCARVTAQSVLALLRVLKTAQPRSAASLHALALVDVPARVLDASILLLLLAALPLAATRSEAKVSNNRRSPSRLSASASAAATAASSDTVQTFGLRKLRLERRMPVGDDEDVNRAFWVAAERDAFARAQAQAQADRRLNARARMNRSATAPTRARAAADDGDDFVTDKVLGALGGGAFTRLETLSLAGMCAWQSAALRRMLAELPALCSLDLRHVWSDECNNITPNSDYFKHVCIVFAKQNKIMVGDCCTPCLQEKCDSSVSTLYLYSLLFSASAHRPAVDAIKSTTQWSRISLRPPSVPLCARCVCVRARA